MKKRIIVAAMIAALVMLASCSTAEEQRIGAMGSYPMREVPMTGIADLQSGSFEVIGMVEGHGSVSVADSRDGDSEGYGSLEVLDVDRMYYGLDYMDLEDPYAVSLANALNDLGKNARALEAAFLTFPSYTVEVVDGRIETTASAIAVKLVNAAPVEEVAADYTVDVNATIN